MAARNTLLKAWCIGAAGYVAASLLQNFNGGLLGLLSVPGLMAPAAVVALLAALATRKAAQRMEGSPWLVLAVAGAAGAAAALIWAIGRIAVMDLTLGGLTRFNPWTAENLARTALHALGPGIVTGLLAGATFARRAGGEGVVAAAGSAHEAGLVLRVILAIAAAIAVAAACGLLGISTVLFRGEDGAFGWSLIMLMFYLPPAAVVLVVVLMALAFFRHRFPSALSTALVASGLCAGVALAVFLVVAGSSPSAGPKMAPLVAVITGAMAFAGLAGGLVLRGSAQVPEQ